MTQETDVPEIPDRIEELMRDEEIENMRNLDGWAVGTVALVEKGTEIASVDDAWIELFNGEGRAGQFGGVRFMALCEEQAMDDFDEYLEAYAYGSFSSFRANAGTGWYVKRYDHPDDPDVGQEAP
jgi:hypothetical protein